MNFTIGRKIFSIALLVLILMVLVAVYSIRLTAKISEDLKTITTLQMPLADSVSRISLHVLEKGLLLQRLFVLTDEDGSAKLIVKNRSQFNNLAENVALEFKAINNLIHKNDSSAPLLEKITAIKQRYDNFKSHGLILLKMRENDDEKEFYASLPQLNQHQDRFDLAVVEFRGHIGQLADQAVVRADHDERNLLYVNSVLTFVAFVFGIGLAALITRMLIRSVHELVAGTKAVESGDLDTEVPVTTKDEIGHLTGSFNSMVGELRLKERIKDTFGKYMDPRIVGNLLDHPEFTEPGGERREMTVMFIDLKGFTSISEKLAPNDLVRMVNGFFTHMTKAIADNNGVVDKFMGDAVMAYWGPPFTEPAEQASLACNAALQALEYLEDFRRDVAKELGGEAEELEIDLRIGVSTGEMIVGTVGSTAQKNFTVMGDPVNLGSRLEGASKAYGTHVLISERTRELTDDGTATREIDLIRVKGKAEPTRIYELLHGPDANADQFAKGLAAYRRQDWGAAFAAFSGYGEANPDDPTTRMYLDRVEQLRIESPGDRWDGVWVFETK